MTVQLVSLPIANLIPGVPAGIEKKSHTTDIDRSISTILIAITKRWYVSDVVDFDVVLVAVEEAAEPPPSVNDDGLFINPLRLLLGGVAVAPVAAATEVVLPSCPRRLLRLVAM